MYLLENEQQFGDKFELLEVEIAGNEALVERFGIRIPVLESKAGELGWPFELEDLIAWLNKA